MRGEGYAVCIPRAFCTNFASEPDCIAHSSSRRVRRPIIGFESMRSRHSWLPTKEGLGLESVVRVRVGVGVSGQGQGPGSRFGFSVS